MPTKKKSAGPEVYKFGGASLADAKAFLWAAQIVKAAPGPVAVVCSAPFGVTDALLAVATAAQRHDRPGMREASKRIRGIFAAIVRGLKAGARVSAELTRVIDASLDELDSIADGLFVLGELTPRTSDLIVSRGERLSARLFHVALTVSRIKSEYVEATEVVVSRGPFGAGAPNVEATDRLVAKRLRPMLRRGIVPVVPGFLGALQDAETGEVATATLGRGGSDLTATLLARGLRAGRVSLWKDVPGLMTADPRIVPGARVVPQLNVREAAELAYYGAKVLHPRALIPVSGKKIHVHVRPVAQPSSMGTEISARHTLDRYPVKALSAATGQALVTVAGRGLLGVPGVAGRAFATLSNNDISVSLISQSSSEQTICFTVPEKQARAAREYLQEAFAVEIRRREVDSIQVLPGMATIAVVGLGMAGHVGIAGRVFSALAAANVNVVAIAQGSSELNISFVVAADQAPTAQRQIHDVFQLSKIGGGAVGGDHHVDVVLLGFGQIGRTLAGIIAREQRDKGKGRARKVRLVAVLDRSGFVFDAKGLAPAQISKMAAEKTRGRSLAEMRGGRSGAPGEALRFLTSHALSRPVLADVTAGDTTSLLMSALKGGMDVVLANKRPMSGPRAEYDRLRETVTETGRKLRFETTVGAGLPVLDTYRKLIESGDKVERIEGCVSGTLGYVLSEVGRGRKFSEVVREAKILGYTEPDPRDDLSGADVGRKALILGRLLGFQGGPENVHVESLVPPKARKVSPAQFMAALPEWDAEWKKRAESASARGEVLRYVASVTAKTISVGLRRVAAGSSLGSLAGTDNQIAFTTARYRSPLAITGAGAGLEVTAGGVLNDILDLFE